MIKIQFYARKRDNGIHMDIAGHSGSAPKGEDLICAAVTTIAYTVAQAVEFLHEDGKLSKKPKIHIEDGKAVVIATPKDGNFSDVLNVFWVGQCGAKVLAHNYPGNVQLLKTI